MTSRHMAHRPRRFASRANRAERALLALVGIGLAFVAGHAIAAGIAGDPGFFIFGLGFLGLTAGALRLAVRGEPWQ